MKSEKFLTNFCMEIFGRFKKDYLVSTILWPVSFGLKYFICICLMGAWAFIFEFVFLQEFLNLLNFFYIHQFSVFEAIYRPSSKFWFWRSLHLLGILGMLENPLKGHICCSIFLTFIKQQGILRTISACLNVLQPLLF